MYKFVYGDDAALSAMFAQATALKINFSKLLQVITDFAMILPYAKKRILHGLKDFSILNSCQSFEQPICQAGSSRPCCWVGRIPGIV
jgi:hypothetical protein